MKNATFPVWPCYAKQQQANRRPLYSCILFVHSVLFAAAAFIPAVGAAARYYLSSSRGNDLYTPAQAKNPSTPWRSLARVNSFFLSLVPGDSVLLQCGDAFSGQLNATRSGSAGKPIVISSFGSGSRPVITGLIRLQNWVSLGNSVWETTLPANIAQVNLLLLNGQMQEMGRYPNSNQPNKGYLTIDAIPGSGQLTDNELPASPVWTGATAVIRKDRWVIDREKIVSHSGSKITYSGTGTYPAKKAFGYFIQNHPNTLDRTGEWYYNPATRKLRILMGSIPIGAASILVSGIPTLVSVLNQQHININQILFSGSNNAALELKNAHYINVNNCEFIYSGTNAINATAVSNLRVESSSLRNTNNIAFNGQLCSRTTVKGNRITNTGTLTGMGGNGSGSYEAIMIVGDDNLLEYNHIDSTGYIPITFRGNSTTIKNNYISRFAFVKDDGAGIYTWNNMSGATENYDRKIVGNIIVRGIGAGEGTDAPGNLLAHGIYIDDNSGRVAVSGNAVAHCARYGIFVHNAHNLVLEKNNVYDNQVQLAVIHDNIAPTHLVRANSISGNIFFCSSSSQLAAIYKTVKNDIKEFGGINRNSYCRPADDNLILQVSYQVNTTVYTRYLDLRRWQMYSGFDWNSTGSPVDFRLYTVNKLLSGNKFTNGFFLSDISGVSAYSPLNNVRISWRAASVMDGGSLAVGFTTSTGTTRRSSVIMRIGQLFAGRKYLVRFSMQGSDAMKTLEVFLRQSRGQYKDITVRKFLPVDVKRTQYEILFTPLFNEAESSLVFDVEEQTGELLLDNISVAETLITEHNLASLLRFEFNSSSANKILQLTAAFVDVYNRPYSGQVIIPSFGSLILLRPQQVLAKNSIRGAGFYPLLLSEP